MKKINSEVISEIIDAKNIEGAGDLAKSQTYKYSSGIERERYDIVNEEQAKYYGKQIGKYELISVPHILELTNHSTHKVVDVIAQVLKDILVDIDNNSKVLIVGLGNRHISADSLGSKVVGGINVTFSDKFPRVMAIAPSVLGLTGIETYDIVSGVINKVKPTHLILIDSLCASSESRLGKSIQITNTGICPGSGIGNYRKCLDKNLAENVVSIGVPLLIYTSTFVEEYLDKFDINLDRINSIMQTMKNSGSNGNFVDLCKDIEKCLDYSYDSSIVTIKDIEECVDILSKIIYKAINKALGVNFEK